jgi:hypothetical protein
MPGRDRIRVTARNGGHKGAFTLDYPGPESGECQQSVDHCIDVTGEGDANHLIVDHRSIEGGVMNKPFDGYYSSWFLNYVSDVARGPITDHLYTGAMPTQVAATKTAALTNPSSGGIDLAVTAGEIREIPHLVKDNGDRLIRRTGGRFLRNSFGYAPLVRDVQNLIELPKSVARTVAVIERLKSKGGIRRTVSLGSWSAQASTFRYVQTDGDFVGGNFDISTTEQVSGHARWTPSADLSRFSTSHAVDVLAHRVQLGLEVDLSTIWNLMPWSWLLDWFFSMGDYLAANRNTIPASLTTLVVMRHLRTTESWPGDVHTNQFGITTTTSPISGIRESKLRAPSFPSPFAAWLPFLDRGQMGILAALAASRQRAV